MIVVASVGLMLCWYSHYIEMKHQFMNDEGGEAEEGYIAFCDMSPHSSCSRAFLSEWGHILSALNIVPKGHVLDQPNPLIGSIYYLFVLLQSYLPLKTARVRYRKDTRRVLCGISKLFNWWFSNADVAMVGLWSVVCFGFKSNTVNIVVSYFRLSFRLVYVRGI